MPNYQPQRLLILSLAAGAGHVQAAEALAATARERYPRLTIRHLEISGYLDFGLGPGLTTSFHLLARYLPKAWGLFYRLTDGRFSSAVINIISSLLKRLAGQRLYRAINLFAPDHIICTNGVAALAVANPPRGFMTKTPFSIVMTDYAPHQYWVVPGATFYFVPSEQIRAKLIQNYRLPEKNIVMSGIPVHSKFYSPQKNNTANAVDKRTGVAGELTNVVCKRTAGEDKILTNNSLTIILLLAGGEGLLPIDEVASKLLAELTRPAQIIAVAGHNQYLYRRLRKLKVPTDMKLLVLGWTDRLDEYMRLAKVIVSKPGGLTVTECLTLGKPLVALSPIPELEEKNAEYIESAGLGTRVDNLDELIPAVTRYLEPTTNLTKRRKKPPVGGKNQQAELSANRSASRQKIPAARYILETIIAG